MGVFSGMGKHPGPGAVNQRWGNRVSTADPFHILTCGFSRQGAAAYQGMR
jgi:hypothetical protein